ncbi:PAS domain S-box protein [Duganella sp. FT3S]|uniref:Virulence sensor protein BvgS n=1 Tax=Rugamonas fusca TaxID=2758568 RepID=A0A7W2EKU0_9BURK|nr:ATP-binding protein [Rugamonas fusca]MBA5607736.1 PAS domain S-box protein [Rugamonas fusca]
MKIQTASRLLTGLLSLMSLLSLGMFLWSTAYMERCQESLSHQLNDTMSAIQFRQGSDTLTAAVRAYAATGEQRYRDEFEIELTQVRQRENAIRQLVLQNDNARETTLIMAAKRASDELVELERRIFQASAEHRRDEALELAYGAEYWKKKAAVLAPITEAMITISQRRSAESQQAIEAAQHVRLAAVVITLLNVASVLAVLLGYYARRVIMPLSRIGTRLVRLGDGESDIHFEDPSAAEELREFNAMLERHAQVVQSMYQHRQDLSQAHRQQLAIFNAASSGIAFTREHRIVDCNELLAQKLGYPREHLIGMPTSELFLDPVTPADQARSLTTLRGIGIDRYERQMVRRSGEPFWARLSGKMFDVDDISQGSVWVVDDISAERLANERMAEARRMADEVMQLKSNFLANMSHEIRTPMSAILGMLHLLGNTGLDARQLDYLRRIDIASKHLLEMLNAVLDFSKLEAGQIQVEEIEFDLERLCEDVCAMLRVVAEAKAIDLLLQVAPGLPRVLLGDPTRLSQILINYTNNALKFTDAGQVEIKVEGLAQTDGMLMLRVEVHDSGIGLTSEQCCKLFQSFVQAEGATTRRYGGSGLGLAICKGLAELMGGKVGVSSTPGVGSIFWFTALVRVPVKSAMAAETIPTLAPARLPDLHDPKMTESVQVGGVDAKALLLKIANGLSRNEFSVRELIVQNESQLRKCLGETYGPLRGAVEQFDFAHARKLWPKKL